MKLKPLISRHYPLGLLLNPETRWVPAHATDISVLFARVRERLARERSTHLVVPLKVKG